MTIRIEASCRMSGDNFSPKLLESITGWQLSRKKEIGDSAVVGPSKGTPLTYGMADLSPPEYLNYDDGGVAGLKWVIDAILSGLDTIKESGAEDVYLDIAVYYVGQCNMAFEPEILSKIAALNMPFWISCYEESDET